MEQFNWYIAVVTPNTERACEKRLKIMFEKEPDVEFDTYVPVQRELHEWPSTGRRKWVDKVLCPCYLFIYCSKEVRYKIACQAKFILHFLMDRANKDKYGMAGFAVIPHKQMLAFQRMVDGAETPVSIDSSRLRVGSKVRVRSGRLKGIEGFVLREPKGKTKFTIRINVLGYASTELPMELLELVDE